MRLHCSQCDSERISSKTCITHSECSPRNGPSAGCVLYFVPRLTHLHITRMDICTRYAQMICPQYDMCLLRELLSCCPRRAVMSSRLAANVWRIYTHCIKHTRMMYFNAETHLQIGGALDKNCARQTASVECKPGNIRLCSTKTESTH